MKFTKRCQSFSKPRNNNFFDTLQGSKSDGEVVTLGAAVDSLDNVECQEQTFLVPGGLGADELLEGLEEGLNFEENVLDSDHSESF